MSFLIFVIYLRFLKKLHPVGEWLEVEASAVKSKEGFNPKQGTNGMSLKF